MRRFRDAVFALASRGWRPSTPPKAAFAFSIALLALAELLVAWRYPQAVKAILSMNTVWGTSWIDFLDRFGGMLLPYGVGLLFNAALAWLLYNLWTLLCYTADWLLVLVTVKPVLRARVEELLSLSVNSLMAPAVKWGAYHVPNKNEPETANCCEGLLALFLAGRENEYDQTFRQVLERLQQELTPAGLTSKTLSGQATVVPTAMFLYLRGLLNEAEAGAFTEKEEAVLNNLWAARNARAGWGRYIQPMAEEDCCHCNTFWAFRALLRSPRFCDKAEFQYYLKLFYPERKSTFGFPTVLEASDRACTTAMMLLLYLDLPADLRKRVAPTYSPQKAVAFLLASLGRGRAVVETEEVPCILDEKGARTLKAAPWHHIALAYSIMAICQARKNGLVDALLFHKFLVRVSFVLAETVEVHGSCAYLHCRELEPFHHPTKGFRLFPTMYLVWALAGLDDVLH